MMYHTKMNIIMIMIFLSFISLLTYNLITFVEAQNITDKAEDTLNEFIYNYTEMQPNSNIKVCSLNYELMQQWLNNPYEYKCYRT